MDSTPPQPQPRSPTPIKARRFSPFVSGVWRFVVCDLLVKAIATHCKGPCGLYSPYRLQLQMPHGAIRQIDAPIWQLGCQCDRARQSPHGTPNSQETFHREMTRNHQGTNRERQGILTSRSSRAVGPSFPSSPSPTATQGWPPFSLSWPNASPSFGIDRVCKPTSARRWRGLGSISLNLQASAGQLLCLGFDLRLHLGANENFLGHTDSSCFDGCQPAANPLPR